MMEFDYSNAIHIFSIVLMIYDLYAVFKGHQSKPLVFEVLEAIYIFFKLKFHPKKTFPFNRLPLNVRNEVIRSMGHKDCINLALTSKKGAEKVQMARMKSSYVQVAISPTARIDIWEGKMMFYPNHKSIKGVQLEVMNSTELKKWTDQSSDSIVKNTARVYNEIERLFRFNEQFTLIFSADYKKVTTVKEVLSEPTLQNWGFCLFEGETIDSEELKMIMDMASPVKSFAYDAVECPIDFRHENAFKFRSCEYEDARWVKIEDLYGLNNCYQVLLGRTKFTQIEIKEFISHWVESDIDMFWLMEIETEEDFDPVEILDELAILHIENRMECFTMAEATKTREKTLLCFCNTESSLELSAWAPGKFHSEPEDHEFDMTIRNKEGVIDLLIEKKKLEMEKDSADNGNKQRISKRLKQLDVEIEDYGVFFVNGKATLRVPTQ